MTEILVIENEVTLVVEQPVIELVEVAQQGMPGSGGGGSAAHTHPIGEVEGLTEALAAKDPQTGDVVETARALAAPGWLPMDGSNYLQASYPGLFAVLGLQGREIPRTQLPDLETAVSFNDVTHSPDNAFIAAGAAASPYLHLYTRGVGGFTHSFPTNPPGAVNGVAFSADSQYLAVAHNVTPFVSIYKRGADGTFTKLAAPATLPTGNANEVAFSPDGTHLAVVHATAPFLTIYSRAGDVFTAVVNPSPNMPPNVGQDVSYSPNGMYMAVVNDGAPALSIYSRNGNTYTRVYTEATAGFTGGKGVEFSPDSRYVVAVGSAGPHILLVDTNNGAPLLRDAQSVYETVSTAYQTVANSVSVSGDGRHVLVGFLDEPYLNAYRVTEGMRLQRVDGIKHTGALGGANAVDFSPDGEEVVVTAGIFTRRFGHDYDKTTMFKVPNLNEAIGTGKPRKYIKT